MNSKKNYLKCIYILEHFNPEGQTFRNLKLPFQIEEEGKCGINISSMKGLRYDFFHFVPWIYSFLALSGKGLRQNVVLINNLPSRQLHVQY